jgi:hypothetical protein
MSGFQDGQIIYIQHESIRLYAETIQVIESRQLCWARPLALLQLLNDRLPDFSQPLLLRDLRQGSDILLPTSLFHVALDVDAIPVMAQLSAPKVEPQEAPLESKNATLPLLHQFIQQVWQAYPEQFAASSMG